MYVPPSLKVHRFFFPEAAVAKNHKHVKLPLLCRAAPAQYTCTMDIQELLHAEELYFFFRRSNGAAIFAAQTLQGKSRTALDSESRRLLSKYMLTVRCKVQSQAGDAKRARK
ncbi:uncharacterized protein BBA_01055 [Beauveria bassiana ARSEF 2860]|uniref:Uncharacterized protein n=1 Tax=Beauveria bassiana (strain ARSEF 2860) TaxID=655819 RepID=J5K7U1_BEAB2|nr:uncharacterized protein BBA_01055 [Beauveria bassiana ARSEF 2860]EJP70186.1 hypothetical protein BBA_01055 [Beauveria bassiana ARSEF 2860]